MTKNDASRTTPIPDLLHGVPMARVDLMLVSRTLRFAFAAGGSDAALAECLDQTHLAFSTWTPDAFAQDLYLDTFMAHYATFEVQGHRHQARVPSLTRLLSHPPSDMKVTRFRQETLRQLNEVPEFRQSFERGFLALSRFRGFLGDSGLGDRLDVNRRRIDVLEAVRDAVEEFARSFEGATGALARLREFGQYMQAHEGYARLKSLLAFEDGMASLDARLRIGHDGQLRNLEIVRISEADANPFYATRLGRLLRQFVLLVRGYRFSEHEVLTHFIDEVFDGVEAELCKFFQLLGDMEFYLSALGFRDHCARHGLRVCLPELVSPDERERAAKRVWHDLFNPLLVQHAMSPVPCTIGPDRHDEIVILTGPNSGGKTRLLQALSLGQLLGQSGVFVPASSATLVWAQAMFLSIADHAEAQQREGRLGSELLRIRKVFESVRVDALVVVDELCSGTNPSEGEEIFRMVVSLLGELSPQAFISTHFLQFAERLAHEAKRERLNFLQVELDAHEQPTYQFIAGVAKTSLAHRTAARLGVTREELLALVEQRKRMRMPPPDAKRSELPAPLPVKERARLS